MYIGKKIYVVRGGYVNDGEVLAAFSSPEKASEFIDLHADGDVSMEECMLDGVLPEPTLRYYRVTCNRDGDSAKIVQIWSANCIEEEMKESFQTLGDFEYEFLVGAHGKQEALSAARHRAQHLKVHWREEFPYLHHRALYKSKDNHRLESYYVLYNFFTHEIVKETPFRTFVRIEGSEDL